MRSRLSIVMAWRGSPGSAQAAIGAGASTESLPWRTRMPIRALVTDLVADQPITCVSIAVARGITLGDHPAIVHDHHGLGVAMRRRWRLREGAVERLLQGGLSGCHDRRARDVGQQGRGRHMRRQGDRRGRLAQQHQATQRTAIDGARLGEAREACAHLGTLAIDLMAGQEAHRREHGRDGLAIELLGVHSGNEGGRAELVADDSLPPRRSPGRGCCSPAAGSARWPAGRRKWNGA